MDQITESFQNHYIETPSDIIYNDGIISDSHKITCEVLSYENFELAADIFYSCYCHDPAKVKDFILPHMKMCLENPEMFPFMPEFIIAYYNGEPAGISAYSMSHFSPMVWEFLWGCVKNGYQGHGIGSVMVEERFERIKKHAKTEEAYAVIRVLPSKMYLNAGFYKCTQMGNDDKWLMWKKIK